MVVVTLDHRNVFVFTGVFGRSDHLHHSDWEPVRDLAPLGLCYSRGRHRLLFMGLHREPFSGE